MAEAKVNTVSIQTKWNAERDCFDWSLASEEFAPTEDDQDRATRVTRAMCDAFHVCGLADECDRLGHLLAGIQPAKPVNKEPVQVVVTFNEKGLIKVAVNGADKAPAVWKAGAERASMAVQEASLYTSLRIKARELQAQWARRQADK